MGYQVHAGSPQEDSRLGAGRTIVNGGLLPCGGLRRERGRTALLGGFPKRPAWGRQAGWRCAGPQEQEKVASSA